MTAGLAQRPKPERVYVGRVDTGAGTPETYSVGLTAVIADIGEDAFWAICTDSRVLAIQAALSVTVQALPYFYFAQSADAAWITSGVPAGWAAYATEDNAGVIYHDTAAVYADMAWACKFLGADPEVKSGSANVPLLSVAALATGLTDAERSFILSQGGNNASVALPWGGSTAFVFNGSTGTGRPIHEMLTLAWVSRSIEADVARASVNFGTRNEKWPVTQSGSNILAGLLEGIGTRGVSAGHFVSEQFEVTAVNPSTADVGAGILRSSFKAQVGNSAIQWNIDGTLTRTPFASA